MKQINVSRGHTQIGTARDKKKSNNFSPNLGSFFVFFFGKFLELSGNFQDFPGNFPEKSLPILKGSTRYFSRKSINFSFYSREMFCGISRNFREENFLLTFSFLNFFREIKGTFFSAEFRIINCRTFLLGCDAFMMNFPLKLNIYSFGQKNDSSLTSNIEVFRIL